MPKMKTGFDISTSALKICFYEILTSFLKFAGEGGWDRLRLDSFFPRGGVGSSSLESIDIYDLSETEKTTGGRFANM